MKIRTLTLNHFLSHSGFLLTPPSSASLILIAGPNGSGKTAVRDAIHLAITGEPVRSVAAKNQLHSLVQLGQTKGTVSVVTDAGDFSMLLSTGKHSKPATPLPLVVPTLLAPETYFTLKPHERRKLVMAATGVRTNVDVVKTDLANMGHAPDRVERACKMLPAGFDRAAEEAKGAATEARGAWRAITGETYGTEKGATWQATPPQPVDGDVATIDCAITDLRKEQDAARAKVTSARAASQAHAAVGNLRQVVEQRQEAVDAIPVLEQRIAELEAELVPVSQAAAYKGSHTATCPHCQGRVAIEAGGVLKKAEDVLPATDPLKANRRLPELRDDLAYQKSELDRARAAVAAADNAQATLDNLGPAPSRSALSEAETAFNTFAPQISKLELQREDLRRHAAKVEAAKTDTERALREHQDAVAYVKLAADLLELPERYQAKALGPMHDAIAWICQEAFDDAPITLDRESMDYMWGSVPYSLASESQQWRMQVANAYALARVSGVAMFLADRFDVVQPTDRPAIVDFFAEADDVQAILFATLKTDPALEEPAYSVWLGA